MTLKGLPWSTPFIERFPLLSSPLSCQPHRSLPVSVGIPEEGNDNDIQKRQFLLLSGFPDVETVTKGTP